VFISRELADSGNDSRMRDARTHEQESTASGQSDDTKTKKKTSGRSLPHIYR
jgi:hypothetical protein